MVDRRCKDGQQGESEIDGVSSGEGRSSGSGSGSNGTMYGFCPITGKRLGAPDKGAKCGKEILAEYGWDSEEENRDVWRARFEALVDRYKRCVLTFNFKVNFAFLGTQTTSFSIYFPYQ